MDFVRHHLGAGFNRCCNPVDLPSPVSQANGSRLPVNGLDVRFVRKANVCQLAIDQHLVSGIGRAILFCRRYLLHVAEITLFARHLAPFCFSRKCPSFFRHLLQCWVTTEARLLFCDPLQKIVSVFNNHHVRRKFWFMNGQLSPGNKYPVAIKRQ